jgi:hypothetical protein
MNPISQKLTDLFNRIPRRHTTDNVKDIYLILNDYETLLQEIEADPEFENQVSVFFEDIEPILNLVKKSTDNKASKKQKDEYFDEASGSLKDAIEALRKIYK